MKIKINLSDYSIDRQQQRQGRVLIIVEKSLAINCKSSGKSKEIMCKSN